MRMILRLLLLAAAPPPSAPAAVGADQDLDAADFDGEVPADGEGPFAWRGFATGIAGPPGRRYLLSSPVGRAVARRRPAQLAERAGPLGPGDARADLRQSYECAGERRWTDAETRVEDVRERPIAAGWEAHIPVPARGAGRMSRG